MFCACSFHGNSMNNLLSYCGLIDAKIRASDKDLSVSGIISCFVGSTFWPCLIKLNIISIMLPLRKILVKTLDFLVNADPWLKAQMKLLAKRHLLVQSLLQKGTYISFDIFLSDEKFLICIFSRLLHISIKKL